MDVKANDALCRHTEHPLLYKATVLSVETKSTEPSKRSIISKLPV